MPSIPRRQQLHETKFEHALCLFAHVAPPSRLACLSGPPFFILRLFCPALLPLSPCAKRSERYKNLRRDVTSRNRTEPNRTERYLPGILDAFEKSVKHQYLLLSSLKEVIVCHATTPGLDFSPFVDQVPT